MKTLSFISALFVLASAMPAQAQYAAGQYELDYIECSGLAEDKSNGYSNALYLGMFYGCMQTRGYDAGSLS